MVNEELYRETLVHIPGSPHIPYLDFHLCKILSAEEHIPSTVRDMINFEKSKYLYNLVSQVWLIRPRGGEQGGRLTCAWLHMLRKYS